MPIESKTFKTEHFVSSNGVMANDTESNDGQILGNFTRQLWAVFNNYANNGRLQISNICSAFNDLDLFPSHSQVQEMVHCAVEYGSPCEANHVTFGEFCVLVDELRHKYNTPSHPPKPRSILRSKIAGHGIMGRRKRKDSSSNFQVFLGGSCGCGQYPSRWRQDEAIPHLKEHNITFYNPQVNAWRPELIELEDRAKQVADVLFFLIDNSTRAVVSLCEISYLVGCGRQIVVMFTDLEGEVTCVQEEVLTDRERDDLCRGRRILVDLIERNGIPVFRDMTKALKCCVTCLTQGVQVQDLTLKQEAQPVKYGHCLVGEALLKLRETFNSITCDSEGKITKNDLRLGYRCFTGQELSASWLQEKRPKAASFSFEEFCCIVAEYRQRKPSVFYSICTSLLSPLTWLIGKHKQRVSHGGESRETFDIYLGGSCGDTGWREGVALPIIKRHGLSYHNAHDTEWFSRLIPMQVAEREKCRLMLYVITSTTRSLASMVEAAYYIGLGCHVVLCLQKFKPDSVVGGEKLSEPALKDYNRGRCYLSDMASREGVPQFEDIGQAVECAIQQIKDMSP